MLHQLGRAGVRLQVECAPEAAAGMARDKGKSMNAVKGMVAAMKGLVDSMHASLTDTRAELAGTRSELAETRTIVAVLEDHVLELVETRAEVERLRAQASLAVSRADDLSDQVAAAWELIRQLKSETLSQDVRIADLEALEGYGWRAPPVYEPTT